MKRLRYLLILLLFMPFIVKADSKYLYDVLKEEVESNGLAKEYTGEHQDSITKEATEKIYHWYASNDDEGSQVKGKNNVIFGGFCWKIMRTTDTGGVRLLYNGKVATDGTCSGTTTEPILTYDNRSRYVKDSFYTYSDSYTYDENTNTFTLSSDAKQIMYDGTNIDQIKNKYTCFSYNTNPCNTLYYVFRADEYSGSYTDYIKALAIRRTTTKSSSIGVSTYNDAVTTPNGDGYLRSSRKNDTDDEYNNDYVWIEEEASYTGSTYVASEIRYNAEEDTWELVNPKSASSYYAYQLAGKYTFGSTSKTGAYPRYIIEATGYYMDYYTLRDPTMWQRVNITDSIYYSDTYIDNNDGTYVLPNALSFPRSESYSSSNSTKTVGKYLCVNGTPDSCYEVWYVRYVNSGGYVRATTAVKTLLASDYTYENGKFTLTGDYYYYWNWQKSPQDELLNTHRYTCRNMSNECDELYYVTGAGDTKTTYLQLYNGETLEEVFDGYLTDNDEDSDAKLEVDYWYENNLIDYEDYIEDSVYCNNRAILSKGKWAVNGNLLDPIIINEDFTGNELRCFNDTDKLSVKNAKAKLKHPIALPSVQELSLTNNAIARSNDATTWTLTTSDGLSAFACHRLLYNDGRFSDCNNVSRNYDLSPTITLKKGAYVTTGDGTTENPYVVSTIFSKITINKDDETEDIKIEVDDPSQIEYGTPIKFIVTPEEGVELEEIKILDSDGNEIPYQSTDNENEYEFIMPASDITIKPIYKKIESTNPLENPETRDDIIALLLILISSSIIYIIFHKKRTSIS